MTDPRRPGLAALVAAALALAPLAAQAQTPPAAAPSSTQRARAKAHFRQGRAYQDRGAYREAIVEYQAAYALVPLPELLFNIGQCYRLGDQPREAVFYYERYLEAVPEGGASDDARAHVAALRGQPGAVPPTPAPAAEVPARPVAGPAPVATAPAGDAISGPPPPPSEPMTWRWIGAGGALAGVALLGGGLYFGLEARDAAADLEAARGEFTPELAAREQDGRDAERAMLICTVAGAGLLVAGGLTFWLARPAERPRPLTAAPLVAPGVAGVAVGGTF